MTYTAKLYRRASYWYAWLKTRKEPRYTLSFLLYAFALEKNRAWAAVLVAVASFLAIPVVLTIITLIR